MPVGDAGGQEKSANLARKPRMRRKKHLIEREGGGETRELAPSAKGRKRRGP